MMNNHALYCDTHSVDGAGNRLVYSTRACVVIQKKNGKYCLAKQDEETPIRTLRNVANVRDGAAFHKMPGIESDAKAVRKALSKYRLRQTTPKAVPVAEVDTPPFDLSKSGGGGATGGQAQGFVRHPACHPRPGGIGQQLTRRGTDAGGGF